MGLLLIRIRLSRDIVPFQGSVLIPSRQHQSGGNKGKEKEKERQEHRTERERMDRDVPEQVLILVVVLSIHPEQDSLDERLAERLTGWLIHWRCRSCQ